MEKGNGSSWHQSSKEELENRSNWIDFFNNCPIPDEKKIWHQFLYINRQTLSRFLSFYKLYQQILDVPGQIFEFGVYYGRDIPALIHMRGIYEPYNYSRKIVGFDTFTGLPKTHEKDGIGVLKGTFGVPKNYIEYLEKLLLYHEKENPLSHIKKFELVEGDVRNTLKPYLEKYPETLISLAYLDMDLYSPTKYVLEVIQSYLIKGSIVVFDELAYSAYPGESVLVREILGKDVRLYRFSHDPILSYYVVGGK